MSNEFKIEVLGVQRLTDAMEKKILEIDRATRKIAGKAGAVVQAESRAVFRPRPAGSGRKINGRKTYQTRGQSPMGDPYAPTPPIPTQRSGILQKSIQYEVERRGYATYAVRIGPTAKYGRAIELGSTRWRTGNKFPYMAPGYERSRRKIVEIYRREWRAVLG